MNHLSNCENKSITGALVEPIADLLLDLEKFQKMIETTIDMDLVDKGNINYD